MANRKAIVGVVISVDKKEGESAGIILNKKEMKTAAFFFNEEEDFKTGDEVRYKLNKKTGVAYEIEKVKSDS